MDGSTYRNYSLINRDDSAGVKGLLIFLIILGHNTLFSDLSRIGMVYLYTFHIHAFFILPFLYPNKPITSKRIVDYFIRLYYPFVLFFILLSILWGIFQKIDFPMNNNVVVIQENSGIPQWILYIVTLLNGSPFYIDYFTGFQFLWFLPVMFSMYILRDFYYSDMCSRCLKYLMLVMGGICFILFIVFGYRSPYDKMLNQIILFSSPFAITKAFGYFFYGILTLCLLNKLRNRKTIVVIQCVFIIGSIFCFLNMHEGEVPIDDIYRWELLLIMPFLFFYIIYYYKNTLGNLYVLRKIGKYSFPIYMIHPFVLKIAAFIIAAGHYEVDWILMIIVQVMTVLISYYISKLIYNIPVMKRLLFPNGWDELVNKKV